MKMIVVTLKSVNIGWFEINILSYIDVVLIQHNILILQTKKLWNVWY